MPADNFHTARAKSLLAHYLKFGLEAAGYRWDGDNQSEVADIVDSIIEYEDLGFTVDSLVHDGAGHCMHPISGPTIDFWSRHVP